MFMLRFIAVCALCAAAGSELELSETVGSDVFQGCLPVKKAIVCTWGDTTNEYAEVELTEFPSVDAAIADMKVSDMKTFAGPGRKGTQEVVPISFGKRQGKLLRISLVPIPGHDDEPANFWVVALPLADGKAQQISCSCPNAALGPKKCAQLISAVLVHGMPKPKSP